MMMFQKHGKIRYCRTVFFSEVFHQMVKSAETVDPREGRGNIPALPSRSQSQLVSSGTSHLGSVKPPSLGCHRGVWVLNHSLGKPCFAPIKLSTGFIWSWGWMSASAEVTVAICETLNEIFSELIKRKSYAIGSLHNECILVQEKGWVFIRNGAASVPVCLGVFKGVQQVLYKWGSYKGGDVCLCGCSVKWPQVRSVCTFFSVFLSRRLDKVTFHRICYICRWH